MRLISSNRKSQVTLFIIIGFIILIVVGLVVWLVSEIRIPEADRDKVMLKNVIVDCLEMKTSEWLMIHGMYSAQYEKDQNTFGLNQSQIQMPDVSTAENELEEFLQKQLTVCINFNTQGFEITTNNSRFDVSFGDRKVDVQYFDLFTANRGEKSVSVSDGSFSINKRVKLAMTNSKEIFQERRDDLYIRDDETLEQDNQIIEVIRDTEDTENWLITDNKDSEPYYFSFLVRLLI